MAGAWATLAEIELDSRRCNVPRNIALTAGVDQAGCERRGAVSPPANNLFNLTPRWHSFLMLLVVIAAGLEQQSRVGG